MSGRPTRSRGARRVSTRARARFVAFASSCALAIVAAVAPARADTPPSSWDRAKDAAEGDRWRLHLRVQSMLHAPVGDDIHGPARRLEVERRCVAAKAMLDDAGAASSPDVRLRFDLGAVEFCLAESTARLDLYDRTVKVLAAAVAAEPDAPGVDEALEEIVVSYAKLNRPREELEAWRRYIPRILDPRSRAVDLMNMGEAEMRLGMIDDALATFREVLRECAELPNTSSTYVLTLWDLAVALDRSGDPGHALEQAAKAAHETAIDSHHMPTSGRRLIAQDDAVFFVPDWERSWYKALGSSALAREATDAHDAWAYWAEAEHEWGEYIAGASSAKDKDRWLAIAEMRRKRAHEQRVAAEKKLPRGSARNPPRDEE